MVDLDPEIWNNPTLGLAATNGFADEMELQAIENAAAKREGREPWIAQRIHNYPGAMNDIHIESSYDNGMRLIDPGTLPVPDAPSEAPVNPMADSSGFEPDFADEGI